MMSLEYIREISRQATAKARRQHKEPFTVEAEDLQDWKDLMAAGASVDTALANKVSIPFLGDYVPKGWRRTEREVMFVDMSGMGAEYEPAMTLKQFVLAMEAGKAYAMIEHGQFQCYIAEYERTTTKRGGKKLPATA